MKWIKTPEKPGFFWVYHRIIFTNGKRSEWRLTPVEVNDRMEVYDVLDSDWADHVTAFNSIHHEAWWLEMEPPELPPV